MLKQQFNEITFTKLTYAQERAKLNKYLIGNCSKKRFRTIEIDPCSFSFFFSEDLKIEIYWRFYYNNSQREFDQDSVFFLFPNNFYYEDFMQMWHQRQLPQTQPKLKLLHDEPCLPIMHHFVSF